MAKNTEVTTAPTLEEFTSQIEALQTEKETALAELAIAKEQISVAETLTADLATANEKIAELVEENEKALAENEALKSSIEKLEAELADANFTANGPASSLTVAELIAKPAYTPVIAKEVVFTKDGKKETSDFKILAPALDIDGVTFTAEELAADKEALAKLASNGSSFLKPYFETI